MKSPWDWRRNYRVWEANRKVFLYPENWIEPELRPPSVPQFQLDEILKTARAQRTSVLFTSAPSERAILAARALAAALGRDLCRVDVTQVPSKFIGETEKHLDRIFAAAAQTRAVLLFDEADALFGTRSDASGGPDRFANATVASLLQRIEDYDGVAILASNLKHTAGAVLARRFAFVLDLLATTGG